ncbi:hypothetical protein L6164_024086 [Bauhinia variegata]|uniref:Uncharacterized protein n=1 Tax=Bauhinia variegata TaxID=167791 RepID=A0ACB9LXZ1_BAUVA|nr:hypothetical protein L6164_024086 [Bauhinia variegata]
MGSTLICICLHKYRQMIIYYMLILFASSSILTHVGVASVAEGRAISKLIEAAQKGLKEEALVMVRRTQIGSRPPKCERRCRNCVHCEAVQVPVAPQFQTHRTHSAAKAISTVTIEYSRGDDVSNYKPIGWKCKCGDNFYNP